MNVRLKDFREANKLQQGDLVEVLGISQSAISRMEALGRDLSPMQIERLCAKYGEEEVKKFASTPAPAVVNPFKQEYTLPEALTMLSETCKAQARTMEAQAEIINRMREKIDELTEALSYFRQQMKN
jgi:transcriptional regulator with XRE-family HTH domain